MSVNAKKFLSVSVNSTGKRQADLSTALADFDKRIKVTVEVEDVVTTEEERDCSDVDLVDKTVEATLKKATWTFDRVNVFWISYFIAFFLGAASLPVTAGSRKKHTLTRSLSDDLAAFGFVDCFEDDLTTAEKYIGFKVDSISIQINRRKKITMTMTTIGRFATAAVADFELPECETPAALKCSDVKLLIGGVDRTDLLWQLGINLNNVMPTGDDCFPVVGTELQVLERGKQPAYTLAPQLLVRKGHAVHTAAKNRTKTPVVVQFGADADEHLVLTFPNTYLELNSKWRQFVGELEQYSTVIDATPMKDGGLQTPLKAEAYLDQTTQLLLT
jgi:hypothetical protein